jgi:transcriptional regulator
MHPDPTFRLKDRAVLEALIEEVCFGTVYATTPDGPRVAHTPIVSTGDGAVQFHLSTGNALTRHLEGTTALVVVNGPNAYISPRWYGTSGEVPTWNYVALELEGRVRRMAREGSEALLGRIGAMQEARIDDGGEPWQPDIVPAEYWNRLLRGIAGFEMEVQAWRPTFKLSQNKAAEEREQIAAGLNANGSPAVAALMRTLPP